MFPGMAAVSFVRRIGLLAWLIVGATAAAAQTASIECPETAATHGIELPASESRLLASDNPIDVSNELNVVISDIKAKNAGISYAGLTNAVLTSFCPVIAQTPNLNQQEKLDRFRRLDSLVRERLSSEIEPPPSSILAQVDLSPDIYRALLKKAEVAGQTPSQYMAALLAKAAE